MLRLTPTTGALAHDTGLRLVRATTDGRAVWGILATPRHGDSIARIDPRTGTVAGLAEAGSAPDTIGVGAGAAWVIDTNRQTLTRVGPAA
jgi:streptogramin lyase